MARRGRLATLFLLLLDITGAQAAADLRAWLDRDAMQLGETVTLNVEAASGDNATPDFSPLTRDFDLLGTSSSSSLSLVNGQASAKQIWAIGLQPKREGRIEIAPVAVGDGRTNPLALTVAPAAQDSRHAGDEVFVEVTAEPKNPYVQQQMRFTVRLYYAVNLIDGSLEDPHAAGVVAQKLGQDRTYQAELGGRAYHVVERHYALVAESSGALTIPPLGFRGHAMTGNDPASMFFARGRELTARSNEVVLDVRPRPVGADAGAWLPAQSLDYVLRGLDGAARVGEPLTLTLNLRAQGLGFEQLPELTLPAIDGAEAYPDKSTTRTRDDGVWMFGERERKFVLVPTRAGTLKLPALRLAWWDTQHDRAAAAEIPAREIEVSAAGVAAPPPAIETPVETASAASLTVTPIVGGTPAANAGAINWKLVAIGSLTLWLVTLIIAVWHRRRGAALPPIANNAVAPRAAREALRRACADADAAAAARALLDGAKAEGIDVRNLGELAEALVSSAQRSALAELQRARFGGGDVALACVAVAQAFTKGFVRHAIAAVAPPPLLAPLYQSEIPRHRRA